MKSAEESLVGNIHHLANMWDRTQSHANTAAQVMHKPCRDGKANRKGDTDDDGKRGKWCEINPRTIGLCIRVKEIFRV